MRTASGNSHHGSLTYANAGRLPARRVDDPAVARPPPLPVPDADPGVAGGLPESCEGGLRWVQQQICNWTYSDERRAKRDWPGPGYRLPDDIRQVAEEGEFNEFDLNEFFRADWQGDAARFEHEDQVQKWLDLIRGAYRGTTVDDLKLGKDRPPLPFSDARLLGLLQHSFWFLPSVASCQAHRDSPRAGSHAWWGRMKKPWKFQGLRGVASSCNNPR